MGATDIDIYANGNADAKSYNTLRGKVTRVYVNRNGSFVY